MTRVAFLGLGAIGRPMAARVAANHPLMVWNRTAARATEVAGEVGATAADTPREAVARADVVITCLPTSKEVEALLDGPDGILAGIRGDAVFVDCTSGDPETSRRIAARLATQGVPFLDAPVSGGTNGAEAGTLTVMVGGDAVALERVRPVLASFGKNIVHLGPVGAGDAMKAVNNCLLAVNILALGEGLAALAKYGVGAGTAIGVLNTSSGRSFVSENLFPERVLSRTFPNTFRLALLHKDIGIAVDLMRNMGVPDDIARAAREIYGAAREEMGESADYLEVVKLLEAEANVLLKS